MSDNMKENAVKYSKANENATEKSYIELLGDCVDSYCNVVVPPKKQKKYKGLVQSPESAERMSDSIMVEAKEVVDMLQEEIRSWCPPPLTMIIMSLLEIACFVADEATQKKRFTGEIANFLEYDPHRRVECWRFLTYMFVHIGYSHLIVNLLVQIFLGIPLERTNHCWRVITVYFAGVVAGCLVTSIMDPYSYLAGASGGVFALLTAHLSNFIMASINKKIL